MKTDRLIAITMYLLNRETVSASALARRFEVSRRTIQRDIDALCQAGIPIAASHGAGGGYGIMDGFGLAKQAATADDALNIIIALKGLCSAYDNKKMADTLEKALATMQGGRQRIFVDFTVAREGMGVTEHLKLVEQAIYDEMPLEITYSNAQGAESRRVVEPLALCYQWYAWYLFAWCSLRQDYRLFKLPRIVGCAPAGGAFTRQHGDVEALMRQDGRSDERRYYDVRLRCRGAVRRQAMEYLGGEIVAELEGGDFILEFSLPMERMWFSLLLGFGGQVEVLEPPELREMLKARAGEIVAMY